MSTVKIKKEDQMWEQSTVAEEPEEPYTAGNMYISENLKKPEYVEMDRQLAMENLQKQCDTLPDHASLDWIKKEVTDEQMYTIEIENYWSDHPEPTEPVPIKAEKELEDRFDRSPESQLNTLHPELFITPEVTLQSSVTEGLEKPHSAPSIYVLENLQKPEYIEVEIDNYWSDHPEYMEPALIKTENELEDQFDGNPERQLRECHPEQFLITEINEQSAVTEVPETPRTPLSIFKSENLKKPEYVKMDRQLAMRKLRKQWNTMPDLERMEWIKKAVADRQRYKIEIKKYCSDHPNFHPKRVISKLTKAEKDLKNRVDGKPKRPPSSGYSLFTNIMLSEMKNVSSKLKMVEISKRWKELTEQEREEHNLQAQKLIVKYKENNAACLSKFPKRRRPKTERESCEELEATFCFQKEKFVVCRQNHPDLSTQDVMKMLAEEYKDLPENEKDKYKKILEAKKIYDEISTWQRKRRTQQSLTSEMRQLPAVTEGPEKPGTASSIHISENLNNPLYAELDAKYKEIYADYMRKLPKKKRVRIERESCEELEAIFCFQKEKFVVCRQEHPDVSTQDVMKMLNKEYDNLPEEQKDKYRKIVEARKVCEEISTRERKRHSQQFLAPEMRRQSTITEGPENPVSDELNAKYKEIYADYMRKLPEKKRVRFERESCEELEAIFCFQKENFVVCRQKHPDVSTQDVMKMLNKEYDNMPEVQKDKYRKIVEAKKICEEISTREWKRHNLTTEMRQQSTVTEGPEKPGTASNIHISENLNNPVYAELNAKYKEIYAAYLNKVLQKKHVKIENDSTTELEAIFSYQKEKFVVCRQKHPDLSAQDVMKMLNKEYDNLPEEQKDKYRKIVETKKVCEEISTWNRQFHPKLLTPEIGLIPSVTEGPERPHTAFSIYISENLQKPEDVKMDRRLSIDELRKQWNTLPDYERVECIKKAVIDEEKYIMHRQRAMEKLRKQWNKLPDTKRMEWIRKAVADEQRYAIEIEKYCSEHPDFYPEPIEPVLTKAEKELKDRIDGKPVRPPKCGFSVFASVMRPEMKGMISRLQLVEISKKWKKLKEQEREEYNSQAQELNAKYKENYAAYLNKFLNEKLVKNENESSEELEAIFCYQKEKFVVCRQKHSDLSTRDVMKILAKEYNKLSERQKVKYRNIVKAENINDEVSTWKSPETRKKFTVTEGPEMPNTALNIYISENLQKPEYVGMNQRLPVDELRKQWNTLPDHRRVDWIQRRLTDEQKYTMDRQLATEKLREQWKTLPDRERIKWIRKAVADERRYMIEIEKYCSEHPDFHPEPIEPVLTKAEKELKDTFDGKPERPPKCGFSMFASIMRRDMKGMSSRLQLVEISKKWKKLKEQEREEYNSQVQKLHKEYKKNFAAYLRKLPKEERKKMRNETNLCNRKRTPNRTRSNVDSNENNILEFEGIDGSCPRKPPSAMFYFQQEKFALCQQKHPHLSKQDVMKILAEEYNDLDEENKNKYRKIAEETKNACDEDSTGKRKCHPEQFPTLEMRQKCIVTEGPHTASSSYIPENLQKPEYVEIPKYTLRERKKVIVTDNAIQPKSVPLRPRKRKLGRRAIMLRKKRKREETTERTSADICVSGEEADDFPNGDIKEENSIANEDIKPSITAYPCDVEPDDLNIFSTGTSGIKSEIVEPETIDMLNGVSLTNCGVNPVLISQVSTMASTEMC